MRNWCVGLVGMVLALTLAAQQAAAITMVNGLGGSAGYGENQLADNDDGSTGFLGLSSVFSGGLNFFLSPNKCGESIPE